MTREYGYRDLSSGRDSWGWSREYCERAAAVEGYVLIARDVSAGYVVPAGE